MRLTNTLKMSKLIAAIDQRGRDYRTGAVSLTETQRGETQSQRHRYLTHALTCNHESVFKNYSFGLGF